ncbi:MAG TPA: carbon storage regulator, partial [Gemmataceae bacterium]|nr:carbon storage regulator [Gemmataceae bacterium]
MLVLTRRVGEEIVIDGDIRITVVDISGDRTRIGISAPPSIRIDRREIYERRQREAFALNERADDALAPTA